MVSRIAADAVMCTMLGALIPYCFFPVITFAFAMIATSRYVLPEFVVFDVSADVSGFCVALEIATARDNQFRPV